MSKNNKVEKTTAPFLFEKRNYYLMVIGLVVIFLGFILMSGSGANINNGVYDPNYFNEDIFSVRRLRIAPTVVLIGFVIEIYAILTATSNKKK